MQTSVFDYRDYKAYLHDWIEAKPSRGRGEKTRMAEHIRCHSAYIAHVLGGDAHFSLEQASDLSAYLGHRKDEQHFFLCLVQLARAANDTYREYVQTEIRKILETRLNLKDRLHYKAVLSEIDQSIYYSAWYYSAIYALISVPKFQAPDAIARELRLPASKVTEVLDFLTSCGLAKIEKGKYRIGKTSLHLGNDSPMISKHHVNWRMRAIQSLDVPHSRDLHYSSVVSLSEKDIPKVRAILVKAIEEVRSIVRDSPEEKVCAYSVDLFGIGESSG
jgi:uncharacterized protein (TIGR02147 family)